MIVCLLVKLFIKNRIKISSSLRKQKHQRIEYQIPNKSPDAIQTVYVFNVICKLLRRMTAQEKQRKGLHASFRHLGFTF